MNVISAMGHQVAVVQMLNAQSLLESLGVSASQDFQETLSSNV
jgi:hypothetical protein